jgi:hypothetical protein
MSVDFMVYGHYDVLSTPPTCPGPKPALLPLALTFSSLAKPCEAALKACGKALGQRQTSYEHGNAWHMHLRLAKRD